MGLVACREVLIPPSYPPRLSPTGIVWALRPLERFQSFCESLTPRVAVRICARKTQGNCPYTICLTFAEDIQWPRLRARVHCGVAGGRCRPSGVLGRPAQNA